jgi:cytochrome c5
MKLSSYIPLLVRRGGRAQRGRGGRSQVFAAALLCLFSLLTFAQQAPTARKVWDGVYTAEQARRGKGEYDQTCSRCHNLALIGSERGPGIKGAAFQANYEKGNLSDLFIKIRDTMPEGGPGTMSDDVKIDIVAYILQQNGYPEGSTELKKDLPFLDEIRMAKKGVWDGVFTAAQSERGKAALSQNGCNGCHGAELDGARGPSLKGERFLAAWENGSVNRLFIKLRDTMPPLNAEQVAPNTKIDIIAHLLHANGFPPGSSELALEPDTLETLQIVRKGAENAGAPNFALVQVLGCLTQGPNGRWTLTNSTEPVVAKEEASSGDALKSAASRPLGAGVFSLVSVRPSFQADAHKGHKVEARGLLYKDESSAELNLTSLAMVAASCR